MVREDRRNWPTHLKETPQHKHAASIDTDALHTTRSFWPLKTAVCTLDQAFRQPSNASTQYR